MTATLLLLIVSDSVEAVDVDAAVGLLETVGRHLERRIGGSRFPLIWAIADALMDEPSSWSTDELSALASERETVRVELEAIPASATPTFLFGDEGMPDVYMAESPSRTGAAADRFSPILERVRAIVTRAQARAVGIRLERRGPRVRWWDRP